MSIQSQLKELCSSFRYRKQLLVWFFLALVFVIAILTLCLTKSPDNVICRVTNATLLTDSNQLNLEFTIRNPNGYYHVRHENINFTAYFQNQTSGSVLNYTSFSQGRKKETRLTPSFNGLQICGGNNGLVHPCDGYYDILVKLNMLDEYKKQLLPRKRYPRNLQYMCQLKVPSNGGGSFNTTRCHRI